MSVPKLRFKEFDEDWTNTSFQSLFVFKNGINASKEQYGSGTKFINVLDIINNSNGITFDSIIGSVQVSEKDIEKNLVKYGDVLFQRSSETREEVGQSNVYLSQEPVVFGGFVIRGSAQTEYDPQFMNAVLKTEKPRDQITQLSGGSTRFNIGQDSLNKVSVFLPLKPEQTKIASFLSQVDEKVRQLKKKHELLSQYKQGMRQKLFSQQIRFNADGAGEFEEWEKIILNEIATRVTRKNKEDNQNTLTISAKMGLVNQQEYFSKQIASRDLTKYYLIHKGEFAYNKSYSVGYPMGAIKRLKLYEKGVVSTLYICFSLNSEMNPEFFEHYVESGALVPELEKIAQEGARNHGLLNISLQEFFDVALLKPCLEEQTKIANFLSAIDLKIEVVTQQIEQAKTWKKGLLQQMFV